MTAKLKLSLEKLLSGFGTSSLVTILYSNAVVDRDVFKSFIRRKRRNENCVLVLLDTCSKMYANDLHENFRTVNIFQSAFEGVSNSSFTPDFLVSDKSCCVFVDSLVPVFNLYGSDFTIQWLMELKKAAKQIICVVNQNCITERDVERLRKISSTVVTLLEFDAGLYHIKLMHKKPHPKIGLSVIFSYEWVKFLEQGHVETVEKQTAMLPTETFPDSLTFNLQLNESERVERQKLVLPYINAQSEASSKIYYEPDKDDDIDEEDPDDDLNI